jgi:hypothetical protein
VDRDKDYADQMNGYYHNSSFRIRADAKPLQRSTKRMKRTQMKPRRKKICLWVGKKTREWMRVRAGLKRKFAAAGITSCELGYPGCWKDEALGFAHGRKRRKLEAGELESLTILVCNPCHDRIETMSPEGMLSIVQSVIAERDWS